MTRPINQTSSARVRIPQIGLAVLIAISAFGFSGAPGIAAAAAEIGRAHV